LKLSTEATLITKTTTTIFNNIISVTRKIYLAGTSRKLFISDLRVKKH
jgi:hypothetical protein